MRNDTIQVELVDSEIELPKLQSWIEDPDVGAHGWFVGVTRRTTDERITTRLAYEAHEPMALSELRKLAEQAVEKFGLCRIVIVHRLGEVPVGQASVVVGCSSAHRPPTFEALAWVMNVLKRDVPIWKQENYQDGSTEWVHPTDESAT